MNIKMMVLALLVCGASVAEVGLWFDVKGNIITPDVFLQKRAFKQYNNGFPNAAMGTLRRSAEFGNDLSLYMISMIHFEKEDWINGLAWLKLVQNPIHDRDRLLAKFHRQLTQEEIAQATLVWQDLKAKYNDTASARRRDKWERSIKVTGSHIGGFRTYANKRVNFLHANAPFSMVSMSKEAEAYVKEIQPEGTVIMGEIKEKQDDVE